MHFTITCIYITSHIFGKLLWVLESRKNKNDLKPRQIRESKVKDPQQEDESIKLVSRAFDKTVRDHLPGSCVAYDGGPSKDYGLSYKSLKQFQKKMLPGVKIIPHKIPLIMHR